MISLLLEEGRQMEVGSRARRVRVWDMVRNGMREVVQDSEGNFRREDVVVES